MRTSPWFVAAALCLTTTAFAQQQSGPRDNPPPPPNAIAEGGPGPLPAPPDTASPRGPMPFPEHTYSLNITLRPAESNHTAALESYDITLSNRGLPGNIDLDSEVPILSASGALTQREHIGTRIESTLHENEGGLELDFRMHQSSLGNEDPAHPTVNKIYFSTGVTPTLGKPILLGIYQDPATHQRVRVEATLKPLTE